MRLLIGGYVAAVLVLIAGAVIGGVVLFDATGADGPLEATAGQYSHNLVTWELRHAPEKWLYKVGGFLSGRDEGDDEAALREYFDLTAEMARLEADDPSSPALEEMEEERRSRENRIEDIIEGRVTAVLEEQGLTLGLPIFSEMDAVFPPVDFEFDQPPRVLAVSPRDRIALTHDYLLRPGIAPDEIPEIESDAEQEANTSALVVGTGGVSTYPSVEGNLDSYEHLVEIVSHEWVHSYLIFYPLGSRYFESGELRTLNETVATEAGERLADAFFERYGDLVADGGDEPDRELPSDAPQFDFVEEMRALRREVEQMLSDGKVEEAEALMERKRQDFWDLGYRIRKLNQAYFAFHGFYATGPGSVDPIGPKVEELFSATRTPGAFLQEARSLTSAADLDRLLSELRSG